MIPIELKDCVGKPFHEAVARVLEYSRRRHLQPIHSIVHGLEIIASEFKEVRDATDKDDIFMELVSVAAMCQRTIEDCNMEKKMKRTERPDIEAIQRRIDSARDHGASGGSIGNDTVESLLAYIIQLESDNRT